VEESLGIAVVGFVLVLVEESLGIAVVGFVLVLVEEYPAVAFSLYSVPCHYSCRY